MEHASKAFGSLTVTDDFSLTLKDGEALGVIGPNGAGKTTMFNLITGDVRPDAGRITLFGADITSLSPAARCHAGIGRSYQIPHPFVGMTVFENVLVGAAFGDTCSEHEGGEIAVEILKRTGLIDKCNMLAGALTLLDRKRLELARSLATQPKVLLLDEIAGGLTEHEVHELIDTIKSIRADGVAIIWIEHIVHALIAVVDRVVAINFGKLLKEGKPEEVMASPEVQEVYMGIDVQ
jgi:branched-chain amino acid transport system ATP-binding protein